MEHTCFCVQQYAEVLIFCLTSVSFRLVPNSWMDQSCFCVQQHAEVLIFFGIGIFWTRSEQSLSCGFENGSYQCDSFFQVKSTRGCSRATFCNVVSRKRQRSLVSEMKTDRRESERWLIWLSGIVIWLSGGSELFLCTKVSFELVPNGIFWTRSERSFSFCSLHPFWELGVYASMFLIVCCRFENGSYPCD